MHLSDYVVCVFPSNLLLSNLSMQKWKIKCTLCIFTDKAKISHRTGQWVHENRSLFNVVLVVVSNIMFVLY